MVPKMSRLVPLSGVGNISMLRPVYVMAKVNIAESIESAKAAVGFFSTFTANVHPYNNAPYRNYQSTVTLTAEEREPSMLCHSTGPAKQVEGPVDIPHSPFSSRLSREYVLDPPGDDKNAYSIFKERIFSSFHERSVRCVALRLWNCRALETENRYSSERGLGISSPRTPDSEIYLKETGDRAPRLQHNDEGMSILSWL